MSELFAKAAARALRVTLAETYALRECDRSLTPHEREWVKDGWVPASVKMEVRDA